MIDVGNISEEYIKCYTDKSRIYMIEHYFKTYDATQGREVQYKLFPRQKDICNKMGNATNMVFQKPRQAGVTTTTSAFLACEVALASPDSPVTVLAIGNKLDLAQQFVTKIKDFINQLPRWFFGEEFWSPDPKSEKNKKKIFEICNNNECKLFNGSRVISRSSGPDASRGVGGVTWLIFDEAAFIENGVDVYSSAVPTVSTGGHVVCISTPNGMDKFYYEIFKQAKLGLNDFEVQEMHWREDPRYNKHLEWRRKNPDTGEIEIIKEPILDESGSIEWNDVHWNEMVAKGYKDYSPWYVGMCNKFNNNPQKIAQELDVSFLGSDSTVIAPEFIEMQMTMNVKEPNPDFTDPMLEDTWIWKPPYDGHRYILGVDNSTGAADDYTAIQIIDLDGIDDENGQPIVEQVLEYNGKLTGDAIGEIVYNYGLTYNNALIAVEDIGGYGSATILKLMSLEYPNLYYDDENLKKFTSITDATPVKVTKDGLPGFHSNSVRYQMLSHFAAMVKSNEFKVRSMRLCDEFHTWVFGKNGRIDHKDGCHDDLITCAAMAMFVADFSMNRVAKAKSRDVEMLRSMIKINSTIIQNNQGRFGLTENKRSFSAGKPMPIVVSKPSIVNKSAYSANMWIV